MKISYPILTVNKQQDSNAFIEFWLKLYIVTQKIYMVILCQML